MRQVYAPGNSVEAHMLKHMLQQAGIEAQIQGEALSGAAGELPTMDLIRIAVSDDDHDEARRILLDWEKANPPAPPTPGFSRISNAALLATLLVGIGIGWLAQGLLLKHGAIAIPGNEIDRNGDGKPDLTYFYENDQAAFPTKSEADSNFDGQIDNKTRYDFQGLPVLDVYDNDFNGTFETTIEFRQGLARNSEIDTDGDGSADVVSIYKDGAVAEMRIRNPQTGKTARINYFALGLLNSVEIDTDGDGKLDTRNQLDRYDKVIGTEAM